MMDINKIYEYANKLEEEFTFEEISKIYREILYSKYVKLTNGQQIHMYQILRGNVDIFTQMMNGREFDEEYLKDVIKW